MRVRRRDRACQQHEHAPISNIRLHKISQSSNKHSRWEMHARLLWHIQDSPPPGTHSKLRWGLLVIIEGMNYEWVQPIIINYSLIAFTLSSCYHCGCERAYACLWGHTNVLGPLSINHFSKGRKGYQQSSGVLQGEKHAAAGPRMTSLCLRPITGALPGESLVCLITVYIHYRAPLHQPGRCISNT